MGSLLALRTAMKNAMDDALPSRVVTRDFLDFPQIRSDDLDAGRVTLLGGGEKDYVNLLDRPYAEATVPFTVVGQLRVAEDSPTSAVEDAEDALIEEIKAFVTDPGDAFPGSIRLIDWRQSGQMEHPYGWISCDIEVLT